MERLFLQHSVPHPVMCVGAPLLLLPVVVLLLLVLPPLHHKVLQVCTHNSESRSRTGFQELQLVATLSQTTPLPQTCK